MWGDLLRPPAPYTGTIQHKQQAQSSAPGAQTCHQQRPKLQRNQNCRLTQIQGNWSRNQNSRLAPESRESGQKSELPVYCLPELRGWNNFDQPFLKVSSRIQCSILISSSSRLSWSVCLLVGSVGRFVKCKSLNTCQNNKMTNDKFKLVKTPPHGQKPSEVFV